MSKRPASSSEEQASTAKPAEQRQEAEEEERISAGPRLHEEMRPSTSSGTAQSHRVRSGETFLQQGTLPVVFRLDSATFQNNQSGDPKVVMNEMARHFYNTKADDIPSKELSRMLYYYLEGVLDLIEGQRTYFPEYIVARGEKATEAYQRALELGETFDKRVKLLLIGQDRVGKTSVGRSLKGEKFKEDESSTEGVQMDEAVKNVGSEPWRNSIHEKEMTAFDHKCALVVSNGILEEMAHSGPIKLNKSPSANTLEIENPESKHESQKVSLPEEEKPKVVIPDRIARRVYDNLTKNRGDGDDGIWPVITDFAGQAIYRAIHPIFVSREAIYVLMFDLTKNLHEIAQCHVRDPGHGEIHIQAPDSNDTNLDHILRWMDLVHSFKHGGDDNILPPVILVGTKADLVEDPSEIIESLIDTICDTTQVFSNHIKERIAVDNTRAGRPHDEEDPNIVNLRNTILKVGEEMPHTKQKVPLKWLQVENKVCELASKGENYITRKDFKMNICGDICQFEPADDFEVLLLFLHDRGTVVYHGYASDPDCLVVLNPKWLIDILCQLITVEKQAKEPILIRNLRKELGKSGVLKADLLDHSCKSLGVTNIKESLLFIMKKFNLLCEYNNEDGNTNYLVPCMLTSKPDGNLVLSVAENESPAPVFLTFDTQYVPGGLFSRLIVLFVEFTSRITDCVQPQLCSNSARFFLGAVTAVEFVCYKRVIKVSIWDYTNSSSDPLDKEPQICLELLSFLQNSLEKLQKECHWMRAVTWDLSARCNVCSAELVTETGECFWHRKQPCCREDCAHYVSLTKKPIACSRTGGRACCPPKTWSQVLKETPYFQALEKQPGQFVNQPRYELAGACPSTSLQDSVPLGQDKPPDKFLNRMAHNICSDWQNLGRELQVPELTIQEISVNNILYPSKTDKAYQVLKAWKNRAESVTYHELCRALNELGLYDLTESLRIAQFLPPSSDSPVLQVGKRPLLKESPSTSKNDSEEEEEVKVESEEEVEVESEGVIGVHVVTEEVPEVESEQATEVEPDEEMEVESGEETEVKGDYTAALSSSVIVFKNTITKQGSHWNLKQVAVHVIFPPGAVLEDKTVTVSRWNPLACSPSLQDNEALVSDVIQLSSDSPEGLRFNKAVTLVISHCAADLKGYEIVVKELIDRDSNDWDDILETVDLRSLADIMKGLASPRKIPDYLLPVAETKITQCSTFVAVCRLKSHEFILSSKGKVLSLPEYPLFNVFIPENAIQEEGLHVTVKLQEIPQRAFKGEEALAGPILRITGSKPVKFQKPVTIRLPISLTEGQSCVIPDLSTTRVRILFQESGTRSREWAEITSKLEIPPSCDGTVVKFNVKHFSGFWSWLEWCVKPIVRLAGGYNTESIRKMAYFAAFVPRDTRLGKRTNLRLYCTPSNKREEMRLTEKNEGYELLQVESSSDFMYLSEKAYVFLPSEDVVKPVKKERLRGLFVSFLDDAACKNIKVHVISRGDLTVEFCCSQERDENKMLCEMEVTLPPHLGDLDKTPGEFFGLPFDDVEDKPSDQVLNKVARDISADWQNLGLELNVPNSKIQQISLNHVLYPTVQQKAYQVLKAWKTRGETVTYDELCRALNELELNVLAESLRTMQRKRHLDVLARS